MKKTFLFLFLILLLPVCGVEQTKASLSDRLRIHVFKLCNTPKARNHENIETLNKAAGYIKEEFRKIGLKVSEQVYEVNGKTYKNIIGNIPKPGTKKIIIGAHYDVAGEQQGADDNASAVAGMIELARLLYKQKDKLTNELDFVGFTLEEPPYFGTADMGSYQHAKAMKDTKADIEYMLNLEMIGYFTDKPNTQDFPLKMMKSMYPTTGNFIAVVGNPESGDIVKKVMSSLKANCKVPSEQLVAPSVVKGVTFSDHASYWVHGFKAVMVTDTAFFRNKNYHKKTDTPGTLNYTKMAQVVEGLVPLFFAGQKTNAELEINTTTHTYKDLVFTFKTGQPERTPPLNTARIRIELQEIETTIEIKNISDKDIAILDPSKMDKAKNWIVFNLKLSNTNKTHSFSDIECEPDFDYSDYAVLSPGDSISGKITYKGFAPPGKYNVDFKINIYKPRLNLEGKNWGKPKFDQINSIAWTSHKNSPVSVSKQIFVTIPENGNVELGRYTPGKLIRIPQIPMNGSGVTWSSKTNTLFIVMNSPTRIVECTLDGKFKRSIELKGFSDTEGITYIKDSEFAVAEEGRGTIVKFQLENMMTAIPRDVCEEMTVHRTGTNKGLEGLAYDSRIDRFYTVKEKNPRKIIRTAFKGNKGELWNIEHNSLRMSDLAGIAVDPVSGNLLILSDESKCVVECTSRGKEISRMRLKLTQPEGITIDSNGTIYVVGEPNQFQKFTRNK